MTRSRLWQRLFRLSALLLLCFSTNGCALLVCDFIGLCHVLPRGSTPESGDVLMAPSGLAGEVLSGSAVSLSWTDLSNVESGYAIDRNLEDAGWTTVATTGANATGYLDSSLTPGGIYAYRVRAVRDQETSDPSASIELVPTPLSGAPTSVTSTGQVSGVTSFNQVLVSWGDAASGETSFQVQRSLNGSTGWVTAGTASANALSYTDTTVSPDVAYYYRARAVFSGGFSAYVASGAATSSTANGSFRKSEGPNAAVLAVAASSTRTYLGGAFTALGGTYAPYVGAIGTNGRADSGFAATGLSGQVRALAVQSDGKLVIGGTFTSYNGTSASRIARLNTDGTLDVSFAPTGTGLSGNVNSIAIQSDGKIMVGGEFTSYNATSVPYVARLNADGTLDAGFTQTGTGLNNVVSAVALQSDGKIVVGGNFASYNGASTPRLARLNTDGSLDVGFVATGSGLDAAVNTVAIQTDGNIVVGGSFTFYNGTSAGGIARIGTTGALNSGFLTFDNTVRSLAIDAVSGDIYAGGNFSSYNAVGCPPLVRLNSDGTRDFGFSATFIGGILSGLSLAVDGSGDVFAAGTFLSANGATIENFVRLNSDGSNDSMNQSGKGFNNTTWSAAPLYDGSGDIYVGGQFSEYNGTTRNKLVRLTSSGGLNTAFASSAFDLNVYALATALDTSGSVYVGGDFTTYNAISSNRMVRLLASGARDPSFSVGAGFSSIVGSLAMADDGSGDLYASGQFASYDGTSSSRIARLNSDGTLDTGFLLGLGFDAGTILVKSAGDGTGSVYAWGDAGSYNGNVIPLEVPIRIRANGTMDASFAISPLANPTNEVSPAGGGKVYIGGDFIAGGSLPNSYLIRVNSDGSADSSFVQGTGFSAAVQRVLPISDGDVVVVGGFATYNGTAVNGIARLNSDGSLDTAFASGVGTAGTPNAFMEVRDGSRDLYLGGAFITYLGSKVQRFLRLGANGSVE